MDHLPHNHDGEEVLIPFKSQAHQFEPNDFFKLPEKYQGYQNLIENGLHDVPQDEAAAFLQDWLYFSLLAQAFGKRVETKRYYRLGIDEKPRISTEPLKDDIKEWLDRDQAFESSKDKDYMARHMKTTQAFQRARAFICKWGSDHNFDHAKTFDIANDEWCQGEMFDRLFLSFAILGETLERDRPEYPWDSPTLNWNHHNENERSWGISQYVTKSMRKQGWCLRDIQRFQVTGGDVCSVYYLSTINPPQTVKDESHEKCTFQECRNPPQNNGRRHTKPECSCHFAVPDPEAIKRVVMDGNIPLLTWTQDGALSVTAHEITDEGYSSNDETSKRPEFVAASHVWTDGLGNDESDNGLPRCQLDDLRLNFNQTREPDSGKADTPFWIDTLCVPEDPAARKVAIRNIAEVYKRAYTVLVIASELMDTSSKTDTLEPAVRILTGRWAQRLWTLQEGILTRNLHFKFRDGMLSVNDLKHRYNEAKDNRSDPYHHCWKAGWLFSPSVRSISGGDDTPRTKQEADELESRRVSHLWRSVQWRQAQWNSDETICLATILDIDPSPLMDIGVNHKYPSASESTRMVRFLQLLDQKLGIPSGMIFLPGPKLPDEGYRWAPRTWMSRLKRESPSVLFPETLHQSYLTRRGLLVEYPGVLLTLINPNIASRFWLPVSHTLLTWYRIDAIPPPATWEHIWKRIYDSGNPAAIILSRQGFEEDPELALLVIVLNQRAEQRGGRHPLHHNTAGSVKWVQIMCRLRVRLETNHAVITRLHHDWSINVNTMIWGERVDGSQKWIVDGWREAVD